MQSKSFLLPIVVVLSATGVGCHTYNVKMLVSNCGPGTPCTVKVNKDPLVINDSHANSKNEVTVQWKAPAKTPWLVAFKGDPPCEGGALITSGGTQSCVVNVCDMAPSGKDYKYVAASGGAQSQDPGISHGTNRRRKCPPRPATPPTPPLSHGLAQGASGLTIFCLDVTSGTPAYCNNGDPPMSPNQKTDPLQNVAAGKFIYFKMNAGMSVTFAKETPCKEGNNIGQTSYCTIIPPAAGCTGGESYCSYSYNVLGSKSGPFQVQVQK